MNGMPYGYTVLSVEGNALKVGISFDHFNRDCEPTIVYQDKVYVWGQYIQSTSDAATCFAVSVSTT